MLIGMFFDGFDVYVAATVLGATLKTGFSRLAQNARFVSVTFVGMMLGSFITGFLGDRYGRRCTWRANRFRRRPCPRKSELESI